MKFRFIIFCLAGTLSLLMLISCSGGGGSNDGGGASAHFAPAEDETWTFMIYIAADNNLDGYDDLDIDEIRNGINSSYNSHVNIIVLQDKSGSNDSAMYRIAPDTYERLDDGDSGTGHTSSLGEVNTGDPAVLSDFISHCKTNFPADRYMLIIWNHGDGTRKKSSSYSDSSYTEVTKAIAEDDTSSDILYIDEVQQAVSANFGGARPKIDAIGFDACLMGTIEVACELKDLASYMCASMASEWGYGWDYNRIFSAMTIDSSGISTPETLAKLAVSSYRNSTYSVSNQTMSAVDLSLLDQLKTAVDAFAAGLKNENSQSTIESTRDQSHCFYTTAAEARSYPYIDLGDFACRVYSNAVYSSTLRTLADDVLSSLADTVILAYAGSSYGGYYGSGSTVKKGLSIFFTEDSDDYEYQWWYTALDTASEYGASYLYGNIDSCTSDSDGTVENWKELMEYWYDSDGIRNNDSW